MTPGNPLAEETREWLAKAEEDLLSARVLTDTGHLANALYFCQQAAEKALKAFLTWNDTAFPKTHDLETIGKLCCNIDNDLKAVVSEAEVLSDFAWKLRYPGFAYTAELEETGEMLKLADRVLEEVCSKLPWNRPGRPH